MQTEFKNALERFIAGAGDVVTTINTENIIHSVSVREGGKKYLRIMSDVQIHGHKGQSSLFCFINLENGDILYPASWAAPAKHARGSIFSDRNGMEGITPYGAKMLR